MDALAKVLYIFTSVLSLLAGVVAALWAYTRYFLERGLLPPVRFYVTGEKVGTVKDRHIIKITVGLHNNGSATLVARNIRLDIRYIRISGSNRTPKTAENQAEIEVLSEPQTATGAGDEGLSLFAGEKQKHAAGRLIFPHSLIKDLKIDPASLIPEKIQRNKELLDKWRKEPHRGFLILEYDTFVQEGIDQAYTFTTTLPSDTLCFLTWCSFEYAQQMFGWQKVVSQISRNLGLIHYTLQHAEDPHTVEKCVLDWRQPGKGFAGGLKPAWWELRMVSPETPLDLPMAASPPIGIGREEQLHASGKIGAGRLEDRWR